MGLIDFLVVPYFAKNQLDILDSLVLEWNKEPVGMKVNIIGLVLEIWNCGCRLFIEGELTVAN